MNPESQQEQRPERKPGPQRKYSDEFRRQALEQMKTSNNIAGLARQLGIRRKWLYHWRDEAMGRLSKSGKKTPAKRGGLTGPERAQKRIADLERVVARQALEIDFFKGALLRIEEKRRKRELTSATPSMSKSGK